MRNYLGPCVEKHIAKWEHYRCEVLHVNDGQFKVNATFHSAPGEEETNLITSLSPRLKQRYYTFKRLAILPYQIIPLLLAKREGSFQAKNQISGLADSGLLHPSLRSGGKEDFASITHLSPTTYPGCSVSVSNKAVSEFFTMTITSFCCK